MHYVCIINIIEYVILALIASGSSVALPYTTKEGRKVYGMRVMAAEGCRPD